MNTPIKQAEGSTSVMAAHFLRDIQTHPVRRVETGMNGVRKNLDAVLPAAPNRVERTSKPNRVERTSKPKKSRMSFPDGFFWAMASMLFVFTVGMTTLMTWSMRHGDSSTFWHYVIGLGSFFSLFSVMAMIAVLNPNEKLMRSQDDYGVNQAGTPNHLIPPVIQGSPAGNVYSVFDND